MPRSPFVELLKESFSEWRKDRADVWASSLAYYTVFSLAPLVVIAIAVAGAVFGEKAAEGEIFAKLRELFGLESARFIQQSLAGARVDASKGIVSSTIGVAVLLFGASQVFVCLQDALNAIWGVDTSKESWKVYLKKRFVTFGMVLAIGFLLLVSTLASAALSAAAHFVESSFLSTLMVGQMVNLAVSFLGSTLLFALIYKVLPDVTVRWKDVWLGAAVTSTLFIVGKALIGLYIGNSALSSSYGAAGSLAVLLFWVYYSAQIVFFGAELTEVYARRRKSWGKEGRVSGPSTRTFPAKQGSSSQR